MKLLLKTLAYSLIAILAITPAFGSTVKYDDDRLVRIEGPIKDLSSEAERILKLGEDSKKPIYLTINTLGGSVLGGLPLIRALEQLEYRGVPTVCVVKDAAMSMGIHILAACKHRLAFRTSLLMWHPAAIHLMFARITEQSAERFKVQLQLLTEYLDKKLKSKLQVSDKVYEHYNENEYIVTAYTLEAKVAPKFLTVIDDFIER